MDTFLLQGQIYIKKKREKKRDNYQEHGVYKTETFSDWTSTEKHPCVGEVLVYNNMKHMKTLAGHS